MKMEILRLMLELNKSLYSSRLSSLAYLSNRNLAYL